MNRLNAKAFFSLFVFQSMALSSLLAPLPAHAEKRSAPAPVKQWVDPGAMEKAKTDAAAPAQNSSTTPTTGDAKAVEHDGKAAPAATSQQSAGDQKTSEKSDTSKSNKMTHPSALEKASKPAEASRSSEEKEKPAVKSSASAKKAQATSAHSRVQAEPHTNGARANVEKKTKASAKPAKLGHAKHGAATSGANDAVADPFDPLNGL